MFLDNFLKTRKAPPAGCTLSLQSVSVSNLSNTATATLEVGSVAPAHPPSSTASPSSSTPTGTSPPKSTSIAIPKSKNKSISTPKGKRHALLKMSPLPTPFLSLTNSTRFSTFPGRLRVAGSASGPVSTARLTATCSSKGVEVCGRDGKCREEEKDKSHTQQEKEVERPSAPIPIPVPVVFPSSPSPSRSSSSFDDESIVYRRKEDGDVEMLEVAVDMDLESEVELGPKRARRGSISAPSPSSTSLSKPTAPSPTLTPPTSISTSSNSSPVPQVPPSIKLQASIYHTLLLLSPGPIVGNAGASPSDSSANSGPSAPPDTEAESSSSSGVAKSGGSSSSSAAPSSSSTSSTEDKATVKPPPSPMSKKESLIRAARLKTKLSGDRLVKSGNAKQKVQENDSSKAKDDENLRTFLRREDTRLILRFYFVFLVRGVRRCVLPLDYKTSGEGGVRGEDTTMAVDSAGENGERMDVDVSQPTTNQLMNDRMIGLPFDSYAHAVAWLIFRRHRNRRWTRRTLDVDGVNEGVVGDLGIDEKEGEKERERKSPLGRTVVSRGEVLSEILLSGSGTNPPRMVKKSGEKERARGVSKENGVSRGASKGVSKEKGISRTPSVSTRRSSKPSKEVTKARKETTATVAEVSRKETTPDVVTEAVSAEVPGGEEHARDEEDEEWMMLRCQLEKESSSSASTTSQSTSISSISPAPESTSASFSEPRNLKRRRVELGENREDEQLASNTKRARLESTPLSASNQQERQRLPVTRHKERGRRPHSISMGPGRERMSVSRRGSVGCL